MKKRPMCTSAWGHKFRPRYDVVGVEPVSLQDIGAREILPNYLVQLTELKQTKTYVCDVCERCGLAVYPKKETKDVLDSGPGGVGSGGDLSLRSSEPVPSDEEPK